MKFFDFCSGIGAGRLGLEKAGMTCVGYSEINRSAIKTYNLLHNAIDEKNYGNLTKIEVERLPDFDLAIAGFPCQTFSVIGKQEGLKDPRGLIIFDILKLLVAKKTKYFIFENVKGLTTHDGGKTVKTIVRALDDAGYYVEYKVLSSMNYGVPQMRQRVYFVGTRKDLAIKDKKFEWTYSTESRKISELLISKSNEIEKEDLNFFIAYLNNKTNKGKINLAELLKQEYLIIDTRQSDLRLYHNRIPTLRSFRDGLYYVRDGKLRTLTGYEAMLIQGFPNDYADRISQLSNRDILRQAGNAMTVGVIESIAKSLIDYLDNRKNKSLVLCNNTIIGVVKTKDQYNYCINNNTYYTYVKALPILKKDVKYVAMYQPKTAFGFNKSGIFLYGEVNKSYTVKRSQISFSKNERKKDEDCVVFIVKEWVKLERPILPSGNAKVLIASNMKKLNEALIYSDLLEVN